MQAIDGPGACQQEFRGARLPGEGQGAARAVDDGAHDLAGVGLVNLAVCVGGGVDHEIEMAGGKREVAHVALTELQAGASAEVGRLFDESGGIAAQDHGLGAEFEAFVGEGEAFQQPESEEPGAAGDEKAFAAGLLPKGRGGRECVRGRRWGAGRALLLTFRFPVIFRNGRR